MNVAEFTRINRLAYDLVAGQYRSRVESDMANDIPIVKHVMDEWSTRSSRSPLLLDVGCGAGVNLRMFQDAGCATTGIEISPKMAQIARATSPDSRLVVRDIKSFIPPEPKYDIVFAKAFLHLYPFSEAPSLLAHLSTLTAPGGLVYAATTLHRLASEGVENKSDYMGQPARFRSRWTLERWRALPADAGLSIVDEWSNTDPRNGKNWINLICEHR